MKGEFSVTKTHDTVTSTPTHDESTMFERTISRTTLLKGAAAAAGALAATPVANALAAPSRVAASAIQRAPSGTITIWDRAGDLFQVFDSTIASFNKKYPAIKVNHVSVDVDSKLPTTLETGVNVPDGAFYEDEHIPIQAAHLYDVSEWIAPYSKNIVPFKLHVVSQGKKVIGIPWDLDPGLLFYRVDLLQKAGIDPMSIGTYDDLLNASRTLQSKLGKSVRPIHLEQSDWGVIDQGEMFAIQQGTGIIDANGKLQIATAPYVRWLTWLKSVMDEGLGTLVQYEGPGDVKALDSGQEVFVPWAIWFCYGPQFLLKKTTGLWRAMSLPAWTAGGARASVMGGSSFIIPAQAKNPYLAWLWYEHLVFSQDGYSAVYGPEKLYPGGLNTSVPSYYPALEHQLFKNLPSLGGQNLWEVAVNTARSIPNNYYYPTWFDQATPYYSAAVQSVYKGQATPQVALQQAADNIQTKLINRS
jgi:lactose/L-arabinose transport system substrate-binding protein